MHHYNGFFCSWMNFGRKRELLNTIRYDLMLPFNWKCALICKGISHFKAISRDEILLFNNALKISIALDEKTNFLQLKIEIKFMSLTINTDRNYVTKTKTSFKLILLYSNKILYFFHVIWNTGIIIENSLLRVFSIEKMLFSI
jgi:hypothetical protein